MDAFWGEDWLPSVRIASSKMAKVAFGNIMGRQPGPKAGRTALSCLWPTALANIRPHLPPSCLPCEGFGNV